MRTEPGHVGGTRDWSGFKGPESSSLKSRISGTSGSREQCRHFSDSSLNWSRYFRYLVPNILQSHLPVVEIYSPTPPERLLHGTLDSGVTSPPTVVPTLGGRSCGPWVTPYLIYRFHLRTSTPSYEDGRRSTLCPTGST